MKAMPFSLFLLLLLLDLRALVREPIAFRLRAT